jgi:hypothetical protein
METVCEESTINKTNLDIDTILNTISKIRAQQQELLNELETCNNEEEKNTIKKNFESLSDVVSKMSIYIDVINNKKIYEN